MSVKVSSYVWDGCAAHGVKGTKLLVMLRLADFSNDEGICYPGIEKIAREIGAGRSTVTTAIGELESDGWLTRKERRRGQRNDSNIYTLNVPKLKAAALSVESHRPVSDTSESDHSKSDMSGSERSENMKKGSSHPPESGGDPSVNSKQDPSVIKPTCQPAAQTDPEVLITDQAKEVLKHLNLVTGSRYQTSKSSLENIRARLHDGFTPEQLILTVDYLTAKWGNDLAMSDYLRPSTLFGPSKFPGYQQSSKAWAKKGRPAYVNGKWQTSTNHRVTPATGAIPPGFSSGLPNTGGDHDGIVN
ncbi:conserved phage C-terminal domain-containing protein [Serratia liquefaciens]|uniref:conserved phage C-terminal domain-containing protein n=1 Tax=Serratia liquefaciens TaxID=614 RepID=UPI0039B0CD00